MKTRGEREESGQVVLEVNGRAVRVRLGTSVAAAMLLAGDPRRMSITREPRGPLCGMGVCMECRATVDGVAHVRTCQLQACSGMTVVTG